PAMALLDKMRPLRRDDGPIFAGRNLRDPLEATALFAVVRRIGRPITAHGFRSTFRTWAAEKTSFAREIAELNLAHVVGTAVELAYQRSYLIDNRCQQMDTWAAFVG